MKDAEIVNIFKRQGEKIECGNNLGISLLSIAEKILARIMLNRLTKCIAVWLPSRKRHYRHDLLDPPSSKRYASKTTTSTSCSSTLPKNSTP